MTFYDYLLVAVDGWNKDPIEDEWLFEKFREQFINRMSREEAFEAIEGTIDVLSQQSDESTATEVVQTLIALARRSDTTEAPSKLLADWPAIVMQFSTFGDYAKNKLKELLNHYRL